MTSNASITAPVVWVAIDVAKLTHQVLIELPNGRRRTMRVANTKSEIDGFVEALRALSHRIEIAFEPTGDYHRPLAYVLGHAGFHLAQVSSLAVARTREALYNSWDKNDPKDAQVILHLLKNGTTQRYEAYRVSRRPHFLGGWGLWDVQVGFRRRCVSAPSGW